MLMGRLAQINSARSGGFILFVYVSRYFDCDFERSLAVLAGHFGQQAISYRRDEGLNLVHQHIIAGQFVCFKGDLFVFIRVTAIVDLTNQ